MLCVFEHNNILSFSTPIAGFRVAAYPPTDLKLIFAAVPTPPVQTAPCRQTVQIESHEIQEGPLRISQPGGGANTRVTRTCIMIVYKYREGLTTTTTTRGQ